MSARPHYLWISRDRPFPPNFGGDWLYSSRMIRATAEAGARITVVCHGRGGPPPSDFPSDVDWRPTTAAAPSATPSLLLSPLPAVAARNDTREMRGQLDDALRDRGWDAAIVDHIGSGWALPALRRAGLRTVYLSHNHEASVRKAAARSAAASPSMRAALAFDAAKAAPLEQRLVAEACLIGVNTEADQAMFARDRPDKRYLLLTPGYDGDIAGARTLAAAPRAALIVGSFGWIAKQSNLLRFLTVAAAPFQAAGVKLMVVGAMPDDFRALLAARFGSVCVTGPVEDVTPWIGRARIGVIAEETGGGFKHKALSYIFGRLPIAALDGACAGLPLVQGQSILSFGDMAGLTVGILAAIDDPARLDRLQAAALEACRGRFDWAERGRALLQALEAQRS